jgi:hypothetical protein
MARNPLKDENQLYEATKGKDIINSRIQKIMRIHNQDGSVQEYVTNVRDSMPDQNGGYVDTELTNVMTDHAGNPLPEDTKSVRISHSGLFIGSLEQLATCSSRFHSANRSRNILVGQDGRLIPQGAICSHCDFLLGTVYIALVILGIGVIYGLYKAVGFF